MMPPRIDNSAMWRVLEFGTALVVLVVLAPLLLLLAAVVPIDDGLPVFFRQKRIGRNGRPFLIYKFRTMRDQSRGSAITVANDTRITAAGRWLRKFKLDELPQLFNVLRGDMSLIGPRPEVPEYVQLDDALWRAVLRSRPGVTDLASLVYRDEEGMLLPAADPDTYYRTTVLPAKLRLSVAYQQARSLPRDLHLLWLTARYSLFPGGFDRERILRSLGE